MKLYNTILSCFILILGVSILQAQDLIFLEGKEAPISGKIIDKSETSLGLDGKLSYLKAGGKKGKPIKLEKISFVLTAEKKLFIGPFDAPRIRDFSKEDYGIIFLDNGKSVAIKSWEVIGADGKIEYEDYYTGNFKELKEGGFVAIYSPDPDLRIFGDQNFAKSRLKNAFLPELPVSELDALSNSTLEPPAVAVANGDKEVGIADDFEVEDVTEKADGEEKTSPNLSEGEGPDMPVDMDEFNEKAKAKVEKFASYVETILEGEDRMRIRSITDQAMILFVSDTCYIEVSSLNREQPVAYKIRRYFNRLNYLADKYTKIEITNGQVVKVSDIRKYKDNWYGTVTYGQRFSGYKDGLLVYTDYTQKNINIVLKVYEPEIEGESQAIWDVLLSNISVTETSK
ncbi:MAG: hypothetical protein R8P61_34160 [Bacteroidia bacterium]|nr:hypothetical protein [Bacteroidia bacterium]